MILILALILPLILSSSPPNTPPLHITQLPIKLNDVFTFKIINRASPVSIERSPMGTFFRGNFSTLFLTGAGVDHEYTATSFTFKYPPQHIITGESQESIEIQIMYTLNPKENSTWKHKVVVMSVSFLVTQYAPVKGFSLSQHIPRNINNGWVVDFSKMLPLVPGLKTLIYKGIHSEYPEDKALLWMVRNQLLLTSRKELEDILDLIGEGKGHGLMRKLSDLNQISQTHEEKVSPRPQGEL